MGATLVVARASLCGFAVAGRDKPVPYGVMRPQPGRLGAGRDKPVPYGATRPQPGRLGAGWDMPIPYGP